LRRGYHSGFYLSGPVAKRAQHFHRAPDPDFHPSRGTTNRSHGSSY
jgi:hypothetical protein